VKAALAVSLRRPYRFRQQSLLACFPEYIGFSYGVSFACCTALPAAFHPRPLNFFLHNRSEPLTFLLKNI